MLKAASKLTYGPRDLTVYCVASPTCRCCMMSLIEDQKRSRSEVAQEFSQPGHVRLVCHQSMRQDEATARSPWIYAETVCSAQLCHALSIQDIEAKTKFRFELILPLECHSGWSGNQNEVNPSAQQELSKDQTSFNSLT